MMSADLPMPRAEPVATGEGLVTPASKAVARGRSWGRQAGQYAAIGLLAFGSYFLVSHYFLQSVTVVGVSMVPTLRDTDSYLLNRWVFYVRSPRRLDVVVLRDPLDNGFSVKRVVAVGGDTVSLKGGEVYVNGRRIEEPYLQPGTATYATSGVTEQRFQCGPGQYFVLGDNRNVSVDSRAYGPVPRQNILGLVIR